MTTMLRWIPTSLAAAALLAAACGSSTDPADGAHPPHDPLSDAGAWVLQVRDTAGCAGGRAFTLPFTLNFGPNDSLRGFMSPGYATRGWWELGDSIGPVTGTVGAYTRFNLLFGTQDGRFASFVDAGPIGRYFRDPASSLDDTPRPAFGPVPCTYAATAIRP